MTRTRVSTTVLPCARMEPPSPEGAEPPCSPTSLMETAAESISSARPADPVTPMTVVLGPAPVIVTASVICSTEAML